MAEKRKWQRPGELRAYHCDVPGCHSSYSSVSNLKQHVRVEHAELYGEKFPNAMRRRRKQSGGKISLKFMSESSVDDEFQESDTSSQQSDSWSFEDETKTQMGEPMFIEEGATTCSNRHDHITFKVLMKSYLRRSSFVSGYCSSNGTTTVYDDATTHE